MTAADLEAMYRLLAIAKYEDRYVIPQAHTELAQRLAEQQGTCGLDFEGGPGGCGALPRPAQALDDHFMLTRMVESGVPSPRRVAEATPEDGDGFRLTDLLAEPGT